MRKSHDLSELDLNNTGTADLEIQPRDLNLAVPIGRAIDNVLVFLISAVPNFILSSEISSLPNFVTFRIVTP